MADVRFAPSQGNSVLTLTGDKTKFRVKPLLQAPNIDFSTNASAIAVVSGAKVTRLTLTLTCWLDDAEAEAAGAIAARLQAMRNAGDDPIYVRVDFNWHKIQEDGSASRPIAIGGTSTPTADGVSYNPRVLMLPTSWNITPIPANYLNRAPNLFEVDMIETLIL